MSFSLNARKEAAESLRITIQAAGPIIALMPHKET